MASAGLLALLDDIATLLDDVAVLSKVALKKTSGVLGDDLALNAEQVSGVKAERELPVVWAVAKGSFVNKLILVPMALLISAFIPWLITPLLMIGGAYLCYEGSEKVLHRWLHNNENDKAELKKAFQDKKVDMVAFELTKIKGAIRTDFILSAEIIVIALGTVKSATFTEQALVVSAIALTVTIFVYGLVAAIVKLDDAGLHLLQQNGQELLQRSKRLFGRGLLWFAPALMKVLVFVGTLAMFLVGGGIIVHGIHILTEWQQLLIAWFHNQGEVWQYLSLLISSTYTLLLGFIIGLILIPLISLASKLKPKATTK